MYFGYLEYQYFERVSTALVIAKDHQLRALIKLNS